VSFYDWMLALHLLSVFAVAASLVLFSALVVVGRRMSTLEETTLVFRLGRIGGPLNGVGMGLALAFGIILALKSSDFEIWNGWIIIAFVLWALVGAIGGWTGAYYTAAQRLADEGKESEVIERLRAPYGVVLHIVTWILFLLLLLDMIFKPGA
jgi:hypothetical protein